MDSASLIQIFIAAILIAAAGGLLGSLALLRRMALVGDALSHIALPGIALGLLFHFNVFLGALAFLLAGTAAIWAIEHKTKLPVDTVVGIIFTVSLAIGAMLTPEEEILEALFGDIATLSKIDFWLASLFSLITISILLILFQKLVIAMISRDLSLSIGLKPHLLEFIFLLVFALTIAGGIKFTGALFTGSLIVIPAATAWNVSRSMKEYMWLSAGLGMLEAGATIFTASFFQLSSGPVFILFAALLFLASIPLKRILV